MRSAGLCPFITLALRHLVFLVALALGPVALALGPVGQVQANTQDRYAVVIGNQTYDTVGGLENARRDARDFANMLRDHRYVVFDGYDLAREEIEDLLRRAMLNIPAGSEIVFYYAGHGIQLGRRNYLLPTDANFQSIYDLPVQSVTLDRVIGLLSTRGNTHVAIVDACRENPFPDVQLAADLDASLFETKSGFNVMATPINSLVAFSTSPGMLAYDGADGANSPYTEAIITLAQERRGDSFVNVLAGVRERVYTNTQGLQVPWESSTLVRPFELLPAGVNATRPEAAPLEPDVETGTPRASSVVTPAPKPDQEPEAAPEPASEPVEKPLIKSALSLTLGFDRSLSLVEAIMQKARVSSLDDLTVLQDPVNGHLSIGQDLDGTPLLVYRPALRETRASELSEFTLTDGIRVGFVSDLQPYELEITFNLVAHACDLEAGDALDPQGVGLFRLPNELNVAAALSACKAAWAEAPDKARFLYQLGRAQQANAQPKEAFASFLQAGEMGHLRALNAAGFMLFSANINRDTVDIPMDLAKATDLLHKGIKGADPFAMHTQGKRLLREGDTAAIRQQGFELLDRAAELGHTYSMNELGYYFLDRDSDHYLPERGMTYLRASAAREDIYGYNNLGLAALYGLDGQDADFDTAYEWFEKAALGGHPFAPGNLGRMIFNQQAKGKTTTDALRWNDMGLERGDGWAGVNGAALILSKGAGGLDGADAAVRLSKAAHLPASDAADRARAQLAKRSTRELGKALQLILKELGEDLGVDGVVGNGTLRVMRGVLERNDLGPVPSDPQARLILAAKAYWAERPTRPDLF